MFLIINLNIFIYFTNLITNDNYEYDNKRDNDF